MKRIINGTTYDTDTATEVVGEPADFPSQGWWALYQTRHGAFFQVICDHDGETHTWKPLLDDEAQAIVEKHANHLVEKYFDGPFPEYGSAERRLTVRIPIGLAKQVEAAAAAQATNVNRYIMRCLEHCVSKDGQPKAPA